MSNVSCNVSNLQLVEAFQAPAFVTTNVIRRVHESAPRFGHSNDLLYLMTGDQAEQRDYVKGLIASSIAIFALFIVWLIFLVVFKCMGPYQVGILSGRPRPLPPMPANDSGDLIAWEQRRSQVESRLNRLRILVIICGMVIVVSACLMSVKGVSSLTRSLSEGTHAIKLSENLAEEAIQLIDEVVALNQETEKAIHSLLIDINGICPSQRPNGICTNLNNLSTCDFSGISNNDVVVNTIRNFQDPSNNVYFKQLPSARKDLEDYLSLARGMEKKAQSFSWALYSAMVFSLALMIICLFIIFAMAFPESRVVCCLRSIILVPLFTLLVIASFLFSMAFIIGSMAVADLCYDSPDDNILVILDRYKAKLTPIVVDIASFYINGKCHVFYSSTFTKGPNELIHFYCHSMPTGCDSTGNLESTQTSSSYPANAG